MPMPWSVTAISPTPARPRAADGDPGALRGSRSTALASRLTSAVTSWASPPRTTRPVRPPTTMLDAASAAASSRVRSTASATTASTSTASSAGQRLGALQPGQVDELADQPGQPVGLAPASGRRSAAPSPGRRPPSSRASASSASAPTGVLSSWLTLATKSRRTASTRRASVTSSTSTRRARALAAERTRSHAQRQRLRRPGRSRGQVDVGVAATPSRRGRPGRSAQPGEREPATAYEAQARAAGLASTTASDRSSTTAPTLRSASRTTAADRGSHRGGPEVGGRVGHRCRLDRPHRVGRGRASRRGGRCRAGPATGPAARAVARDADEQARDQGQPDEHCRRHVGTAPMVGRRGPPDHGRGADRARHLFTGACRRRSPPGRPARLARPLGRDGRPGAPT